MEAHLFCFKMDSMVGTDYKFAFRRWNQYRVIDVASESSSHFSFHGVTKSVRGIGRMRKLVIASILVFHISKLYMLYSCFPLFSVLSFKIKIAIIFTISGLLMYTSVVGCTV